MNLRFLQKKRLFSLPSKLCLVGSSGDAVAPLGNTLLQQHQQFFPRVLQCFGRQKTHFAICCPSLLFLTVFFFLWHTTILLSQIEPTSVVHFGAIPKSFRSFFAKIAHKGLSAKATNTSVSHLDRVDIDGDIQNISLVDKECQS